jgi:allantoate deiminase
MFSYKALSEMKQVERMTINQDRLWNNLMLLAEIGKDPNGGITRLPFTKEDLKAKSLVKRLMEQAGLLVREDAVGNVIGRKEGSDPHAPIIVIDLT